MNNGNFKRLIEPYVENDPSEDESFFTDTIDTYSLAKSIEPEDRYNLAYLIFYLLGMIILIPQCFLTTAEDYWLYKFHNINNSTNENGSSLKDNFMTYLNVAIAIPGAFVLFLCIFLKKWMSLNFQIIFGLSAMLIFFMITTMFVEIDTDQWQFTFFVITMLTVILINVAGALYNSGIYGLIGNFKPKYITALTSGQSLGGIFSALVDIISLTFSVSQKFSAFIYFIIADMFILFSLFSYIILSRSTIYTFYTQANVLKHVSTIQSTSTASGSYLTVSNKVIFNKIKYLCLSMWLIFTISFCIFPAVTGAVASMDKGHGNPWNDLYFVPTVGFLLFSLCDYIGRILSGIWQKPSKTIMIVLLTLARIILIPLIMLCNVQPRFHLPVVFDNDWYFIVLIAVLGYTNGYFTNLIYVLTPKLVENHEKETSSFMITASLGFGVATGSLLTFLTRKIV